MLNIKVKELIWSKKNTQQIIWWLSINSKVKVIPSRVNKKMEENIKKKKKKKKSFEYEKLIQGLEHALFLNSKAYSPLKFKI